MRTILVFEPRNGQRFSYEYLGPLKHFDSIEGVLIYCTKMEVHKEWTSEFKIRKDSKGNQNPKNKPIEVLNT